MQQSIPPPLRTIIIGDHTNLSQLRMAPTNHRQQAHDNQEKKIAIIFICAITINGHFQYGGKLHLTAI